MSIAVGATLKSPASEPQVGNRENFAGFASQTETCLSVGQVQLALAPDGETAQHARP